MLLNSVKRKNNFPHFWMVEASAIRKVRNKDYVGRKKMAFMCPLHSCIVKKLQKSAGTNKGTKPGYMI